MRYFIGYIVIIVLLIVLILFLFAGGGKHRSPVVPRTLNSYASTDAQVQVVIDGPIVAYQLHQQVRITISSIVATWQHIQGYDGQVVASQNFANTENGYYAFLGALMQSDFTRGVILKTPTSNSGLCPLGSRYNFKLMQDGQVLQNYWATSCGGLATFKGNVLLTLTLFKAQIPGYSTLNRNIAL